MTTVLVVDDSRMTRDLVSGMLSRLRPDWKVVHAPNPKAALRSIERTKPDAALVDIVLPGLEGLQLAQYLRERFPQTPIGVASGDPSVGGRKEAEKLGCFYVAKPVTADGIRLFVSSLGL